jgi:hypothetical protein
MKNVLRVLFVGALLTVSILAAAQAQQSSSIPFCRDLCIYGTPPTCHSDQPGSCYCDDAARIVGTCALWCSGYCDA